VIDRLFWWYAQMRFPTERFDAISAFPNQVKAQAMTPLCHTSVTKWTLAAGAEVSSKEKYERCAKVAGELDPETWRKGHCPACGSLPTLSLLKGVEGRRYLLCSFCGYEWRMDRLCCPAWKISGPSTSK
jgi:hypothetical protein